MTMFDTEEAFKPSKRFWKFSNAELLWNAISVTKYKSFQGNLQYLSNIADKFNI